MPARRTLTPGKGDQAMIEFLRSTTIILMGLTVISAGVFVVVYG